MLTARPAHGPAARRCSTVLAIAALAVPATAAAAGPVPIDTGLQGSALNINTKGQIVGGGDTGSFLWKQGAGKTPLAGVSVASAINDAAMVAGSSTPDGNALIWTPASGAVGLATLGGESYRYTWASDVNEHSQVVGRARDNLMTQPTDRAILWTPEGWMVDLGTLPAERTAMAAAINDNGQIVGTSGERGSTSYGGHAFLSTQAGPMADLGVLPGADYSQAKDINNKAQVVGESGRIYSGGLPAHAFLWTQAGGMVDLGTLPGATDSHAYGINDRGQVVGESGGRPFLWSQATGMTELGTLPGDAKGAAYAINDQGQVAGTSRDSNVASHAVLWFGDTTRPTARIKPVRGEKLADVRSRGLRVQLTMSEPGSTELTLRLGSAKTKLATKTVTVTAAGASVVTFKLSHRVRVALRKVKKATFTVRSATRDLAGNSRIATAKLTIKR